MILTQCDTVKSTVTQVTYRTCTRLAIGQVAGTHARDIQLSNTYTPFSTLLQLTRASLIPATNSHRRQPSPNYHHNQHHHHHHHHHTSTHQVTSSKPYSTTSPSPSQSLEDHPKQLNFNWNLN